MVEDLRCRTQGLSRTWGLEFRVGLGFEGEDFEHFSTRVPSLGIQEMQGITLGAKGGSYKDRSPAPSESNPPLNNIFSLNFNTISYAGRCSL